MKLKDLKHKPFQMECCKECKHKDINKCLKPLCIDLQIHNDLIKTDIK